MSADLCSRPLPRGVLYEKERRKESRPASGFVFLCNNRTERECLDNRVFGLHESMKYRVFQVKEGDILFLHNYQANRLHGVFEAVSNGGMNLVPYAFGGKYPAQVRVRRKLDCPWVDKGALLPLIRKGHIRISRRGIPIFPDRLGQRMIDELYRIFLEIPPQFRTKMIATDFKAEDGHYTNSYGERYVDNWLHRHLAFKHIYSYAKELDGYTMRCDWYIPDLDLYIEYWEEPAPASADTVDLKRKLYADHFLRVIHLYENDLRLQAVRMLIHLGESGPVEQSQLAEQLDIKLYTMSRILAKLELHRYIKRKRSGNDKIVSLNGTFKLESSNSPSKAIETNAY